MGMDCTPLAVQGISRLAPLPGLRGCDSLFRGFPGLICCADHRLRTPPVSNKQWDLTQRPRCL